MDGTLKVGMVGRRDRVGVKTSSRSKKENGSLKGLFDSNNILEPTVATILRLIHLGLHLGVGGLHSVRHFSSSSK